MSGVSRLETCLFATFTPAHAVEGVALINTNDSDSMKVSAEPGDLGVTPSEKTFNG